MRVLAEVLRSALREGNVLVEGPPGVGKTVAVREVGIRARAKVIVATASATWTEGEVIGGDVLRDGGVRWRSGVLLRALVEARSKRTLLVFDEVNRCDVDKAFGVFFTTFPSPDPEDWNFESLKDMLEARDDLDPIGEAALNCLSCSGCERAVRRNLRIAVTMNTVDYATTFAVGEAFRRRFYVVRVAGDLLKRIIEEAFEGLDGLEWLKRFMLEVSRRFGVVSPVPLGPGPLKAFLKLRDVFGDDVRAFCNSFVSPSLAVQPGLVNALEEILANTPGTPEGLKRGLEECGLGEG